MEFLIIAIFVWGIKGGWDHLKADYGRSRDARIAQVAKTHPKGILPPHKRASVARQHASGYWLREALHGFPVYRTGMHSGWIAHKTARVHAEGQRAEAQTTHAETTASVQESLREHRQRQREAAAEAEAVWADPTASVPPGSARQRARAVADIAEARRRRETQGGSAEGGSAEEGGRPHAPLPSDTVGQPEPGPYARQPDDLAGHLRQPMPDPRLDERQRQRDREGRGFLCAACGRPGTEADPLVVNARGFRTHASHEAEEQQYEADMSPATSADAARTPSDPTSAPQPSRRGPTVADTTYDSAMARSAEVGDHAEGLIADITTRREEIEQMADDMQGSGVGAKTVSAAMDAVDLWGDAEKALTSAAEGEENFAKALQSHYSELNEATQNAPDGAADPSFHEG